MSNIGLMEGAYFVGRKEVVDWINATTDNSVTKVEDTANGAVACQILDIMYPGQVPMHKVNWGAKQNFEFVANYKILQTCFTKLHIDRHIDVDRLISGRYMDNLEFMQWFKRYYELSGTVKGDYDGVAVRLKGKGAENEKPKAPGAKPATITGGTVAPSAVPKPAPAATKKETVTAAAKPLAPPAAAPKPAAPVVAKDKAAAAAKPLKENKAPAPSAPSSSSSAAKDKAATSDSSSAAEVAALKQANEEAQQTVSEMRVEMEGLEKERDFYFDKLRDIEILLQENEDAGKKSEVSEAIFAILYKTADGFAAIEGPAPQSATKAPKEDVVAAFPLESVEEASEVESY